MERQLDEVKATNNRLSKDNFMKQTKITKVEELLQKAMQENMTLKAREQEAQQLLDEMNEDAEDYELEIQTLKLRLCEQQATMNTLEKTNAVLSKTDENDRVRESLKKLGELEKRYQTVSFAKDELELQLTAANEMMKDSKIQETELIKFQKALRETEEQLADIEIQNSSVTKENSILKENIVRLEDGLKASEIEKDKLRNELKAEQKSKKSGYVRGGLFIGNYVTDSNSKTEGNNNIKFDGPETSTPLSSPPGSIHSRSFEIPARKQRVLKRHYSLDSLNVANFNRGLNGRLSTSLDNLDGDWFKDCDVTPEVMDTSYDSLTGSEFSVTVSDVSGISRKQSLDEVRVKVQEDWETVSDVSSVMTADTCLLTDLETNADQSDSESVKCLKQRFEQVGGKQPSKTTRRRSSSLTRTPSLTTLVEKHEEGTSVSEEVTNLAEATASASKVGGKVSERHAKSSNTKISDLSTKTSDTHTTYTDRSTKTGAAISPVGNVKPYDNDTKYSDMKVSILPAKPSEHKYEVPRLLQNTPNMKLDITSTDENVQVIISDVLVNPGDAELKCKNTEATFESDRIESASVDSGDVKTTSSDIKTIVSDALSSNGDFEPDHGGDLNNGSPNNGSPNNGDPNNLPCSDSKSTAKTVIDDPITTHSQVKQALTDIKSSSISQDIKNSSLLQVSSEINVSETKVHSDKPFLSEVTEQTSYNEPKDIDLVYSENNKDAVLNDAKSEEETVENRRYVSKTDVESSDVKIVSETWKTDDILNHPSQLQSSDQLSQPDTSVLSGEVILLEQSNLSHSSVSDNSRNLEAAIVLTDSNLSSKMPDVRNSKQYEQKLLSVRTDSIQGPDSLQDATDAKKNTLPIINTNAVPSSGVKRNVKDMKSLWEKRDNKNANSREVKNELTKETNVETRLVSPSSSTRSGRTVSPQASNVNDSKDGETPRPAKVSELVSLWNKFN